MNSELIKECKAKQTELINTMDAKLAAKHARIEREVEQARIWTVDQIKVKIAKSNVFVERSLRVLFSFQTPLEQESETTHVDNGAGFNSCDANILSSFAKQCDPIRNFRSEGNRLSLKQLNLARRKLVKYAKQLAVYANSQITPVVQ